MLARKASLNQLTQNSLASIPDGSMGYGLGLGSPTRSVSRGDEGLRGRGRATPINGDVDVGDQVNTPGGMHGTVKFIGSVKGKAGVFVGVELDPDMAGRGKNDGAVDGLVTLFFILCFFRLLSDLCTIPPGATLHYLFFLSIFPGCSSMLCHCLNLDFPRLISIATQCPLLHHRSP